MNSIDFSEELIQKFECMDKWGREGRPFLFVVDYEGQEGYLIDCPLEQEEICFTFRSVHNGTKSVDREKKAELKAKPLSLEDYHQKFAIVRNALLRGDSFLANLTVATPIETNLSLEEIYHRAQAPYKLYIPHRFVCFSPERFVRIDLENLQIETHPMKGTIKADLPCAEERILQDPKERAEHYTIVDLMRNDLAQVGREVEVASFRYIDRISTLKGDLLQVSSCIRAHLPQEEAPKLGTILRQLLPAGSICGAPKKATLNAIAQAEAQKRGFYTGVMAYFDGKVLESAVLIRFIEEEGGQMFYRSGGGITINSVEEEEYQEVLNKVYFPFS